MKTPLIPVLAALGIASAHAGTTAMTPSPSGPVMTTTTDDGWEFTLGLYAWGAGLDGDIGAAGYTTSVDIPFSDILDTLDMTAMGSAEIRKGRWLFQFEGLYLRNSVKGLIASTPVINRPRSAKLTAETTRLEAVGGYRLVDEMCTTLDLLAGVVYYDIANELSFSGPFGTTSVESQDNWIDPIIGLRLQQYLTDRWSLRVRGDVGGFGVNAELAWQAIGLLGFDMTQSSTFFAGYRYAAVDYENGGFLYDAASGGPILGVAISF